MDSRPASFHVHVRISGGCDYEERKELPEMVRIQEKEEGPVYRSHDVIWGREMGRTRSGARNSRSLGRCDSLRCEGAGELAGCGHAGGLGAPSQEDVRGKYSQGRAGQPPMRICVWHLPSHLLLTYRDPSRDHELQKLAGHRPSPIPEQHSAYVRVRVWKARDRVRASYDELQ